jgi:hypothetical protein
MLVDTLPVTDPQRLLRWHVREKGCDQCRFANTRLPRDKTNLTLPLEGSGQPLA